MTIDRMQVNAAIEQLLAGTDQWEERAQVIVNNCKHIPPKSLLVIDYSSTTKSDGESITGHAPGQGNVTIHDKPTDEHKEFVFGKPHERIGYFKVWKERRGELGIKHWWKADLGTKSLDDVGPPEHYLGFDKDTFRPKYFCVVRERLIFSIPGLRLSREYLEPIYGVPEKINRAWVLR
jgi:hypothetical protein